ncbi:hypothetical protein AB0F03_13470 [Streptomyces sp. NPDC028722]|uniref:hypothetical protein n=1 Tax=Streptomyces sp. NPDC028722 TaxID=3155016 RepID=UPI0033ED93DE
MFSRKKLMAVAGLVGGLAVTCAGLAQAHVGSDPGACTRDESGAIICTQQIKGQVPADGVIPHQETCMPVQPTTLPAATGGGTTQFGPRVTCSPSTTALPPL